MQPASDVRAFLSHFVIPAGQHLELRLIVPDAHGAAQHFCSTIDEAIAIATRAHGTANVYVGACPRCRQSGNRDAVTAVVGAWADLDFHQIDPNRDLAFELAYQRIESLGLPPTTLVHTGNGLQPWWLFHQPAAVDDEWPAERFESINNGLAERLGGDHVHDLARVLRVPGTMNLPTEKKRERGCVPVMARLLSSDGPTYDPSEFASIAIAVPPASSRVADSTQIDLRREPNPDVLEAFTGLLDALDLSHPLVRTWRGDRDLVDDSRSGWDMAMANQLVRAGIRDEFIPHILRAFPKGRGATADERYLARTIAKAQDMFGDNHEAAGRREA